jgi:ATP-dependent helicase/nuclease subunit B
MKLLIGQTNSGKSEIIFSRMAELVLRGQGNPLLVAPSTTAVETLLKRLQAFMPQGLPENARPVPISFPALAQRILKIAGQDLNFLNAIQRDRILRRVVAELAEQEALVYFDKTADKSGLVHTLAAFINELWRSNTTADDFARITRNRTKKDADIALIFNRFEAALRQAKAVDAEGAGVYALRWLERIYQGEVPNREQAIKKLKDNFPFIAADGFDFYTSVQVKMLSRLSRLGIEIMASHSFEPERAVHLWQKRTMDRFIAEGAEMIYCKPTLANDISEAAARLMNDFTAAETAVDATAKIKIISAPDRAVEVRAVAREIKRLALAEHFALQEISVVCRSLDLYAHHFDRVFEECAIPLEVDRQISLGENPFIVALLRLLSLGEKKFSRRALLESLRSPYCDFSEIGLDEQQVDVLEHISLTEKVTHERQQWREAIEQPSSQSKGNGEVANGISIAPQMRSGLAQKLEKLFDWLTFAEKAHRREYVRRIEHLITALKMSEKRLSGGRDVAVEGFARNAQAQDTVRQDTSAAALQRAAVNSLAQDEIAQKVFLELLKALADDSGFQAGGRPDDGQGFADEDYIAGPLFDFQPMERQVSWKAFFAELQSAVAATAFLRPKEKPDAIVVQEAHNLRPRNYRAIFIIGLIEGEFPKKNTETTPYTLAEKIALREAGIDFAETINDAGADVTQFHKALTRATERLFLSYARTDFSGGELLRSYLIDEVQAVANTGVMSIAQLEKEGLAMSGEDVLSLDELALRTARHMRKQFARMSQSNLPEALPESSILLQSNLSSWSATLRGALMENRRLAGRERGIFGGIIKNPKLIAEMKSRFGEDYLWSASKINDYGLCPFRFFANNVLNLSPVEEPSEGFVADRLGTAYHEILEKTYRQLKEQGIELTDDAIDEAAKIAEKKCEEVLQKLLVDRKIRRSGLWDFDKSEIKKRIVNLLRSEIYSDDRQAARPLAFEQSFGLGNQPPLVIGNSEGLIRICGSIDRIDKTDEGLVVIDYKTSRSPISAREAVEGRNLQLPIYLMAANRVLKRSEPVTAGFYLHIYSCKRGSELPNKNLSLDDITAQAEAYIGEYVSKARGAEFPVEPNQHRCPPYCKFDVMCRIQSLGSTSDED